MAANTDPIFPVEPLNNVANTTMAVILSAADTTDILDLITGATDGTIINAINATSDDPADKDFYLYFFDGTSAFILGRVTVPDGSGTNGTDAAFSVLNSTDIPALAKRDDGSIFLAAGQKIQIAAVATLTADKVAYFVCIGGNY